VAWGLVTGEFSWFESAAMACIFLVQLQRPLAKSFGASVLPLSVFRMLFKLLLTVNSIADLDL
jgi:hypothetical protein